MRIRLLGLTSLLTLLMASSAAILELWCHGPVDGGGVQTGGGAVSRSGLFLFFGSFVGSFFWSFFGSFFGSFLGLFLGLVPIFRDFPDLSGDCPGLFPICPFPLSQPSIINSTYEEQSRKGPRHDPDLSWTRFGNPPVYLLSMMCRASLKPQNAEKRIATKKWLEESKVTFGGRPKVTKKLPSFTKTVHT